MPKALSTTWTIRKVIQNTRTHSETKNRFDYKVRDMVRAIKIEKVSVYDGKNPGEARTKFTIRTQSTPQYYPYYTPKDSRGRPHKRQFKYRHSYQVIIQLDELSIDVPFKARLGALGKWDFSPAGRAKIVKEKSPRAKKAKRTLVESTNVLRGLNGDFFFRCSYVWKNNDILFGRDWTNGQPPRKVNPNEIVFFPKHVLAVCEYLMNIGKLK